MPSQIELSPTNSYTELKAYMKQKEIKNSLLVCGASFDKLKIKDYFDFKYNRFSDFTPNPLYEQCISGADLFKENSCDAIIAVGGGSAIDVAKCIRFYSGENVPFIAIPTTAGTGSESTRFAVIYKDGEKQSIESDLCFPDVYVLDETLLDELPQYHKKCAMLDALCHGIESYWSINATSESQEYAYTAINMVVENMEGYLNGDINSNRNMLVAANIAGKAINVSKTTAGHAMSYKLTSDFGMAHGHAVALCDGVLIDYMVNNIEKYQNISIDLKGALSKISIAFGLSDISMLPKVFNKIVNDLLLEKPKLSKDDCDNLSKMVNIQRLANHPVNLSKKEIRDLYLNI